MKRTRSTLVIVLAAFFGAGAFWIGMAYKPGLWYGLAFGLLMTWVFLLVVQYFQEFFRDV